MYFIQLKSGLIIGSENQFSISSNGNYVSFYECERGFILTLNGIGNHISILNFKTEISQVISSWETEAISVLNQ